MIRLRAKRLKNNAIESNVVPTTALQYNARLWTITIAIAKLAQHHILLAKQKWTNQKNKIDGKMAIVCTFVFLSAFGVWFDSILFHWIEIGLINLEK